MWVSKKKMKAVRKRIAILRIACSTTQQLRLLKLLEKEIEGQ